MDNHRTFTAVRHKKPECVQVDLVDPMCKRAVDENLSCMVRSVKVLNPRTRLNTAIDLTEPFSTIDFASQHSIMIKHSIIKWILFILVADIWEMFANYPHRIGSGAGAIVS